MRKGRIEAFSDGVIAIIITIMVLEMKAPHDPTLHALRPLLPVFVSYVLSFIFIGIYWNNHHHLMHAIDCVNGTVLWANLHLLFWLSLIPFVTAWMGENDFAPVAVSLYGVVMLFSGVAYFILTKTLVSLCKDSVIAKAIGADFKGRISVVIYAVAVPLSLYNAWLGFTLYIVVAAMWLVPDSRIERFYNTD